MSNRIPGNSRKKLRDRGSPIITKNIYVIVGPLQKGESGSPILNSKNEVIAVVDGGSGEINWAMPINEMDFQSKLTVNSDLNEISLNDPEELFSTILFEERVSKPPKIVKPIPKPIPNETKSKPIVSDNCYQVKRFDGRSGFAFRKRPLDENETKISNLCVKHFDTYGDTNCEPCRQRKEFDDETYIMELEYEETVKILGQQGSWYKVRITSSGIEGFFTNKFRGLSISIRNTQFSILTYC
ncbi:MAG: hypothetical protein EOO43_23415 [Flavobacterium sp.]|nr:MAG: hypothetical protein EOO43_23415 [Flavobacterium sp.]